MMIDAQTCYIEALFTASDDWDEIMIGIPRIVSLLRLLPVVEVVRRLASSTIIINREMFV